MMKWFDEIKTIEELRKCYKKLLQEHHPDNGGNVSDMQEINAENDVLFDRLKAQNATGQECNNEDETAQNEAFKAILNEIIGFNMTIEIIGSWIWIFDGFTYKKRLKEIGFKWCSKKKAWIWHNEPYKRYSKSDIPLSHIRSKYGSEVLSHKQKQPILD